jgi:protein-disulfide isomerase
MLRLSLPLNSLIFSIIWLTTSILFAAQTKIVVFAQAENEVAAVVNGREITQKEVDGLVFAQLFPLQQQIYALRKTTLENLILRAVLEDEAGKKNITVEDLRKQLTAGEVEVLRSQIEQIYLENVSAFAAMSPDEAKERIRLDLESQTRMRNYRAALLKLKEKSKIELRLKEPDLLTTMVNSAGPSIGNSQAKITIVEFSDFQCPYCQQSQQTIKQILQTYRDDVRLVFKHLPLEIHSQAFSAAQAAFCADEQGQFWEFHDALFAANDLSPKILNKIATEIGLNIPRFKTCFESEGSRAAVLNDLREAKRLGIEGTPTFFINNKMHSGVPTLENFKNIIERELNANRQASLEKGRN